MKNIKKIGAVLFVILAFTLVFSASDSLEARSSRERVRSRNSSHHRGSSSRRPPGGRKDNNGYAKDSKSGKCKKVRGHCVTFSRGGCGNFYINGYHYGGSKACSILGRCKGRGGNGGGSNVNTSGTKRVVSKRAIVASSTASTSTITSILTRSCTPGAAVDGCPEDTLGDIMTNFQLNPSFANSKTNKCPLFWTPGVENENAKIVCMIEYNGVETEVPTNPKNEGFPNGYPVDPGKFKLTCTRVTTIKVTDAGGTRDETLETEQSANFNCRPYPTIREI